MVCDNQQDRALSLKRSSAFGPVQQSTTYLWFWTCDMGKFIWLVHLGTYKKRVAGKCKMLALNHYCYLVALCDWKSSWEFWGLQKLISADQELELISWFRIFYSEVYISEFFLIEFFIMISVVFFLSFLWRHTLTMWLITSLWWWCGNQMKEGEIGLVE